VDSGHISLNIARIFQLVKVATAEVQKERNQLNRKLVEDIKEIVYL